MENTNKFSYIGYQEMIADITTALEKTGEVMDNLELDERSKQAKDAAARLKSHIFSVGIMGEFKRGKSTVINALLGEEVAPADVVPASATLNRITYGLKPKATIVYKDGKCEEVPVNKIADYVTKITEESAATAKSVEQAVVEYPCQFCKNNVEIIDTPGLNDDERMNEITESVIPKLDAVVMVLSAGSPFSLSEAEFVRNKLMTSDVTRMVVLVNRMDTIYSDKDKERILQEIKRKITAEVLDRTAAIHGEDSKLYEETKNKLAGIQVYPLSAIQALVGRIENKPELVEQSGILVFEERLRKLLTEERGALEITRVANVISTLLTEGANALELRINTLEMNEEKFLENKKESEEEIKNLRKSKVEEKDRIRQKGVEIKRQAANIVDEKYDDLSSRLNEYLDNYPIDINALKSDNDKAEFQNNVKEDLEREVKRALSEYTEQINVFLQEQMGDECLRIQEYMGDFAGQLVSINEKLKNNEMAKTIGVIGVDALSNLVAATCTGILSAGGLGLMGLGGLVEGYRKNGAKGAATGLAGGLAAGTATAVGLIFALGTVPFLPFAIITGIAGTLGGKLLTSVVWKKDIEQKKINEVRNELKKIVTQIMTNLKEQKLLETWANEQIKEQIDCLIAHVEEETEAMISGTEATLQAIAADISANSKYKEQKLEQYKQLENKLKNVNEILTPILNKVMDVVKQTA